MAGIQNEALALLNTAQPGEGLLNGANATDVLRRIYRFAGRLGLMGGDDVSLERAVAMCLRGFFNQRKFRLNELEAYLKAHFGFVSTREKKAELERAGNAQVFSEEALRETLVKAGVTQDDKTWSTVTHVGDGVEGDVAEP